MEEEEKKKAEELDEVRKVEEDLLLYKTPSQNFLIGSSAEDNKEAVCTCHLKIDNLERGDYILTNKLN